MRRKRLLLFVAFVVVVLVAGWLLVPFDPPRITQANCDKVEVGMTDEQVRPILGERYFTYPVTVGRPHDSVWMQWCDDDGNAIVVGFIDGFVIEKGFSATKRSFIELVKPHIERRIRAVWP